MTDFVRNLMLSLIAMLTARLCCTGWVSYYTASPVSFSLKKSGGVGYPTTPKYNNEHIHGEVGGGSPPTPIKAVPPPNETLDKCKT